MKTSQYLDLIQKEMKLKNDNQVRVALKWSMSKVNNYRHNKQGMDNEAARQIAEILDVPVLGIIADMEAMRQKDASKKEAWRKLAKMSKEAGAATLGVLFLMSSVTVAIPVIIDTTFYILCELLNNWKRKNGKMFAIA